MIFEKKAQLSKTLNFVEKTFLLLKNRNVLTSVWKYVKIMAHSGIRTPHLRIPNRGDTRHIYYTKHQGLQT